MYSTQVAKSIEALGPKTGRCFPRDKISDFWCTPIGTLQLWVFYVCISVHCVFFLSLWVFYVSFSVCLCLSSFLLCISSLLFCLCLSFFVSSWCTQIRMLQLWVLYVSLSVNCLFVCFFMSFFLSSISSLLFC